MHAAFGTVVVVVCVLAVVVALVILLLSRRTWEDYGKRGLIFDSEQAESHADDPPGTEIRELLDARNARRARRGEPQLDVEREMSRLSQGAAPVYVDPKLRAEIRDLMIARSSRLVRAGKPPLDVEREVERELERLARPGPPDSG